MVDVKTVPTHITSSGKTLKETELEKQLIQTQEQLAQLQNQAGQMQIAMETQEQINSLQEDKVFRFNLLLTLAKITKALENLNETVMIMLEAEEQPSLQNSETEEVQNE